MKMLINLGSLLLSKALQEHLDGEIEGVEPLTAADILEGEDILPDFIVADCHTLRRNFSIPQNGSKIILVDYGLGEEEISSLLLSYKIDGIISTTTDLSLFKKAIQAISEGQIWIDNRKVKALVHHAEASKGQKLDDGLSKKEREIVILISQGMTNREIASMLCISEQTVKTHISRIFRKLKVSRRSQLVPMAMKLRISETT
jgi:DNA-binding NarL/FixJ family response regulator